MTIMPERAPEPAELADIVFYLRQRIEQLEEDIMSLKALSHTHGQFGDIEYPFARRP